MDLYGHWKRVGMAEDDGELMNDPGLWFVNDKVSSLEERDRVWAAYNKKWDRAYRAKQKVERRHKKELAVAEEKYRRVCIDQPYTPWVGHTLEGGIPQYIDDARREWKRRQGERNAR